MITNSRPLIGAGTLMGIGLGGFFDGILFHQILELHNMLSNWVPRTTLVNAEINMFWDGLFHAFCYLATLTALFMLWRSVTRPDVLLSGQTYFVLCGWAGAFSIWSKASSIMSFCRFIMCTRTTLINFCFGIWCFWAPVCCFC